ncbi:MAG: serine hydroxymethyltransferase [Parvibaculaceae bacterium]|nr:serine hydroxymethyltransferase [Parvibaculaceae bacterium]
MNRDGREVIFEFVPVGISMKVSAIDVETGKEVSIVGPSSAAQTELEAIALRKLRYVLQKAGEEGREDAPAVPPDDGKGGIVV